MARAHRMRGRVAGEEVREVNWVRGGGNKVGTRRCEDPRPVLSNGSRM